MKTLILAFGIASTTALLTSCSVTTTSYDPGPSYTTYSVGYSYPAYRASYWGPRYTGYGYYDSDFYVGDRVLYGPRYHRNVWRGW